MKLPPSLKHPEIFYSAAIKFNLTEFIHIFYIDYNQPKEILLLLCVNNKNDDIFLIMVQMCFTINLSTH